MSVLWHYLQNGTTLGPISGEQLRGLITSGVLRPSDQVWHEGMDGWAPIQAVPELITASPLQNQPPAKGAPTPPQPASGQPQAPAAKSNKVLVWVLGGCGGLLTIVLVGCVVSVLWMKKKVANLQSNPAVATAELMVRANPELEVVSTDYTKGTITMRNKKTGETLTMDANQAKEGRFTFKDEKGSEMRFNASERGSGTMQVQGPEGQVSFGAGTKVQAPAWMPTYPGAPMEGVMSATGKDGMSGTVVQKTTDSPTQVIEAFEKAFKAGGFTVGTVRTPEGGMVIGDQKAMKRHVMATIGTDRGQTVVTITYKEGN
jgi:GYF domain 2